MISKISIPPVLQSKEFWIGAACAGALIAAIALIVVGVSNIHFAQLHNAMWSDKPSFSMILLDPTKGFCFVAGGGLALGAGIAGLKFIFLNKLDHSLKYRKESWAKPLAKGLQRVDIGLSGVCIIGALAIATITLLYLLQQVPAYYNGYNLAQYGTSPMFSQPIGYYAWEHGIWLATTGIASSCALFVFGTVGLVFYCLRTQAIEEMEHKEHNRIHDLRALIGL